MYTLKNLGILFLLSAALFSCSTGNHVATERLVQKRKYTKGYHISGNKSKFSNRNEKKAAPEHVAAEHQVEKNQIADYPAFSGEPNSRQELDQPGILDEDKNESDSFDAQYEEQTTENTVFYDLDERQYLPTPEAQRKKNRPNTRLFENVSSKLPSTNITKT